MPETLTIIARVPPEDGREWDCQCARCGSSCHFIECNDWDCDHGYQIDDDGNIIGTCDNCLGYCGWNVCGSGDEWCEANPLPGRESVERGQIEWFVVRDLEGE